MVAASSATVEVEVAEKKEDETGLQEREGVVVAAWWLCRLPMVELVFVVVFRSGVLVFSPKKAAVEEVVAASAATVEVAVAEKKEDETGLQDRERERRSRGGCLWLC